MNENAKWVNLTDNIDYHILIEGIELVKNIPGMTCELGIRMGGGSHYIMEALAKTNQRKTHIGIDPYGNILYQGTNGAYTRYDYTNEMRNKCMINLYQLSLDLGINFLFFPLEDTEFFKRYADGVPVYQNMGITDGDKFLEKQYSFVFLDGPHSTHSLITEFNFFNERMSKGAVIVFDDHNVYDINYLEQNHIFSSGWELVTKTSVKASYIKK